MQKTSVARGFGSQPYYVYRRRALSGGLAVKVYTSYIASCEGVLGPGIVEGDEEP